MILFKNAITVKKSTSMIWTVFRNLSIVVMFWAICISCSQGSEEYGDSSSTEILSGSDKLTIISHPEDVTPDTVELKMESVFESNDEVYMGGYISKFAVDDSGRVFIVSSMPGNLGVYVFNSDGSYLTTIGSFGQGPGEFEAVSSISILNDELLLFDPRLKKFAIYSLDNFEKLVEERINIDEIIKSGDFSAVERVRELVLIDNDKMILQLGFMSSNDENDEPRILYYSFQRNGSYNINPVLEVMRYPRYYFSSRYRFALPVTKPFNRSTLVSISQEGQFFTAWTEDFLIKKWDINGNHLQSLYYPYINSEFLLSQIEIADHEQNLLRNYELPDTWPALHTMELDDEGRLWVATITDSETEFTWYILNKGGDLLARFTNPGERNKRFVVLKPKIAIKNGFFYEHERDMRQGIDRVIKYRIEIIER